MTTLQQACHSFGTAGRTPVSALNTGGVQHGPSRVMRGSPAVVQAHTRSRWCSAFITVQRRQQRPVHLSRRSVIPAAAAAVAAAAAPGAGISLLQAISAQPGPFLAGCAALVAGAALAVFLIMAIPTLVAMRRTAVATEALVYALEREVPETAAALRLSGLELSDCIEEMASLSNDLTQGVRASARAVTTLEQGLRGGAAAASNLATGVMVPAVRSRVPAAAGAVEAGLKERAELDHTGPTLLGLASVGKQAARQARIVLAAVRVVGRAAAARNALQLDRTATGAQ